MNNQGLHDGLQQIPVSYLKDNLLPMLKDNNSPLIFEGDIAYDANEVLHI